MEAYAGSLWWARALFLHGLAAVYLVAFVNAFAEFPALLGDRGLLPVRDFVARVRFRDAPSVFHARYDDRFLRVVAGAGVALALGALVGVPEHAPLALSIAWWLVLWALYLSIVNVGQTFYGFGWETLLLECGFFGAFFGPSSLAPSGVVALLLRWLLFRVELGAGLIKLRNDPCWRNLTCLDWHYETQPLPNPLSRSFHRLPKLLHRGSVLTSHVVQLVAPFGLFAPQPVAAVAGAAIVVHQLWLIVSGNYAWLNWLTVVLGVTALSDASLAPILGAPPVAHATATTPAAYHVVVLLLAGVTAAMSVEPVHNFLTRRQAMNRSYNPLHLVSAYGAFGHVTRERFEVVLEASDDGATWREYELKGKPGAIDRVPPQVAPYHLRLDWLMWFLPFSTLVDDDAVVPLSYDLWFLRLVERLLEGDRATLRLLRRDPFDGARPRWVRARFYRYRYADRAEQRATGAIWHRTLVGEYLPALSLADVEVTLAQLYEAPPPRRRRRPRPRRFVSPSPSSS